MPKSPAIGVYRVAVTVICFTNFVVGPTSPNCDSLSVPSYAVIACQQVRGRLVFTKAIGILAIITAVYAPGIFSRAHCLVQNYALHFTRRRIHWESGPVMLILTSHYEVSISVPIMRVMTAIFAHCCGGSRYST